MKIVKAEITYHKIVKEFTVEHNGASLRIFYWSSTDNVTGDYDNDYGATDDKTQKILDSMTDEEQDELADLIVNSK